MTARRATLASPGVTCRLPQRVTLNIPDYESNPVRPVAEIISIGDELTSGQRLDTNSQWLSQQLSGIGIRALYHTTVADDAAAMVTALENASKRTSLVVTTGGLGPTADDLTRQVIADVAGVGLRHDEPTLQHIRRMFKMRGRDMPENNARQARFPAGARIIRNPIGTAPGIDYHFGDRDCRVFSLPGVPAELKPMWDDYVRQQILKRHPETGIIRHHSIHCFGLAESDVESRLSKLTQRDRIPIVGITASKATISLRISASGNSDEECKSLIEPTRQLIYEKLGDHVFGENDTTLQQVVIEKLRGQNRSLSVIDLAGCSLIGDWMHQADPEGTVYRGVLGLAANSPIPNLIDLARSTFKSDLVIVLGPAVEKQGMKQREVWISSGNRQVRHRFDSSPSPILVPRSIKQALNFLRLALEREKI